MFELTDTGLKVCYSTAQSLKESDLADIRLQGACLKTITGTLTTLRNETEAELLKLGLRNSQPKGDEK